jgi:hypothetical protein
VALTNLRCVQRRLRSLRGKSPANARCPTCRGRVTSSAVDLAVEQKALERDRVAAAERWHYEGSVEVLEARKRLLAANHEVATVQIALTEAERATGVWGEG